MNDLISRQDVINAILDLTDFASVIELFEYVEDHDLQDKRSGGIIDAIDAVLLLPSAQPESCEDAVSRSNLRLMKTEECAGHTIEYAMGWKACIEWIKTLPSAQPEPEHTMEEFMYGQELGDPEDGSL